MSPQSPFQIFISFSIPFLYFLIVYINTLIFLGSILQFISTPRFPRFIALLKIILYSLIPLLMVIFILASTEFNTLFDLSFFAIAFLVTSITSFIVYKFLTKRQLNKNIFILCLLVYGALILLFPKRSNVHEMYGTAYECSCIGFEVKYSTGFEGESYSTCYGLTLACTGSPDGLDIIQASPTGTPPRTEEVRESEYVNWELFYDRNDNYSFNYPPDYPLTYWPREPYPILNHKIEWGMTDQIECGDRLGDCPFIPSKREDLGINGYPTVKIWGTTASVGGNYPQSYISYYIKNPVSGRYLHITLNELPFDDTLQNMSPQPSFDRVISPIPIDEEKILDKIARTVSFADGRSHQN